MRKEELFHLLCDNLPFTPTEGQATVLRHLSAFLLSTKPNPTYIIKGYAGTGKTSLLKALVKTLPVIGMQFVLLAPTGRAAKIMSSYTGKTASTIHRKLYHVEREGDGFVKMKRAINKHKNTIFIVDEASMIDNSQSNGTLYTGEGLLDSLMYYVTEGERCRLLLIGDNAQLPPVGRDYSPALDENEIRNAFNLTIASYELTEVKRQALESGILFNATKLRQKLETKEYQYNLPLFTIEQFKDIKKASPEEFEELLYKSFAQDQSPNAVVICKSNKRANLFNQAIRARILGTEGEIATGDILMVVKNNYYWTDSDQKIDFIANGDLVEIKKINKFEEMYGFHFVDAEICFIDTPENPYVNVKILLETLTSNSPSLTAEESQKLIDNIEEDYYDITDRKTRWKEMRKNPWLNALQVKFGYALTCHKTQGGQWAKVFIDAAFNLKEEMEREDLRWLYTALTRAQEEVYLIQFKEEFFE